MNQNLPHVIGLKMALLDIPGISPAGNLIGSLLLYRAIMDALDRQNILFEEMGSTAGALNTVQQLFTVTDDRAALDTIRKILESSAIREFATLFRLHPGEQAFLPCGIDPANIGCGFTVAQFNEQKTADVQFMLEIKKLIATATDAPPSAEPPITES